MYSNNKKIHTQILANCQYRSEAWVNLEGVRILPTSDHNYLILLEIRISGAIEGNGQISMLR